MCGTATDVTGYDSWAEGPIPSSPERRKATRRDPSLQVIRVTGAKPQRGESRQVPLSKCSRYSRVPGPIQSHAPRTHVRLRQTAGMNHLDLRPSLCVVSHVHETCREWGPSSVFSPVRAGESVQSLGGVGGGVAVRLAGAQSGMRE